MNVCIVDSFEVACQVITSFFQKKISKSIQAIPYPMQDVSEEWLNHLLFSLRKNWEKLHLLEEVPFIPVVNQSKRFFLKMSKAKQPISFSPTITKEIKVFLLAAGAFFVDHESLGKDDPYFLEKGGYILNSTPGSIIGFIEQQSIARGNSFIKNIVSKLNNRELNRELMSFLADVEKVPEMFHDLPLFPAHQSNIFLCASKSIVMQKKDLPDEWTVNMFPLVDEDDIPKVLTQKLKLQVWSRLRISQEMVQKHLGSMGNISSFFDRLLEEKMDVLAVDSFKPYLHIETENGTRQKPAALFEITPLSREFFFGQKDCFPSPRYDLLKSQLEKFGLKSESQIDANNVKNSISEVANNADRWTDKDILAKVAAIFQVSLKNSISIHPGSNERWIPTQNEKPSNYPKSLPWFKGSKLVSVYEVFVNNYQNFIGSVAPVVHNEINNNLIKCFTQHLRKPTVPEMLNNLKNIQINYDDEEKGCFKEMVIQIYKELHLTPDQVLEHFEMLTHVWQGNGFITVDQISLVNTTHSLNPYYYEMPKDVADQILDIMKRSVGGSNMTEYNLYLDVLKRIANKDASMEDQTELDTMGDLKLSVKLVKWLTENRLEKCLEEKENIYVPVESNEGEPLKLYPVTDCYCIEKSRSSKYSQTYSANKILHHTLSREVASKLKVPSLISKVLGGKGFFKPCGQTEPLTLRLNRLLDEYRDGLAIIKELIQNADDAGATTVKLLYDKRLNNDKKELLVDPGMKHWQGPALWVYNDQTFTENDFENITKLNAGTKEFDTNKIGKFGLGFNSVYHLTDVPSFLSGDSLVIFDPHTCYLGEALESKDVPGIRIPLSGNMKELSSFKHQFEIFNGVFDARFDFQSDPPFSHFDGTLFRLPLRKQEMSEQSLIKNQEYSDSEMRELIQKLKESLEDIILFTENVKHLEVWEMSNTPGDNTKCLFTVSKHGTVEQKEGTVNSSGSIVAKANQQLRAIQQAGGLVSVLMEQNVTKTLQMNVWHNNELSSTRKWLICSDIGSENSFKYALHKKGHLPCGGVAIPFINDGANPSLTEHSGRLFCFLPLPIKSCLPVHLNAAFDVLKNRQALTSLSTDDKSYRKEEDWNKLLSKDLGKSYFNLFAKLAEMFPDLDIEEWMKNIMPKSSEVSQNPSSKILVANFLQRFFDTATDVKVIPTPKGWLPWKSIRCLDQSFNKKIVQSCIEFMNWLYKGTHQCIVFPKEFHCLANEMEFSNELNKALISQDELYISFLNHIGEEDLDHGVRKELLNHILGLKREGEIFDKLYEVFR